MRYGLALPQVGAVADPTMIPSVAAAAERAGFTSLWAMDRLLAPLQPRTPYPATPDGVLPPEQERVLDPLMTLTLAATATSDVRLGTNVLVAPWYPPVLLARSFATLDQLSHGRAIVGLGLGWSADEYEAVGVSQRGLGAHAEEVLDVLEAVWAHETVEHDGPRYRVAPSIIGLKPVQRPRPPVVLAAYTEAGLDRIARRADGWTPAGLPVEAVAPMWSALRDLSAVHGRDPDGLQLIVRANVKLTPRPLNDERPSYWGTVEQVLEDLAATAATGAHEVILDVQSNARSGSELLELAGSLTAGLLAPVLAMSK
jgi:probable F420-dependent oxidoreductase